MPDDTSQRRWYRFSLRALLVFVVVLGTVFGWVGAKLQRAREQKATVQAIEKLGGIVMHDSWWVTPLDEWVDRDFFFDVDGVEFWYSCDDAMRPNDPPKPVTDESIEELIVVLPHLEYLSLGKTRITDAGLAHLTRLPKLEVLWLNHTQVTDAGLEHLKGLPNLEDLWLQDTQVTDDGLRQLKRLTQLQNLDLSDTQVTDAGLQHLKGLTSLQWLCLSGTQITDAGLHHLTGLTELKQLRLRDTQITAEGVEELQRSLPNCTIFR